MDVMFSSSLSTDYSTKLKLVFHLLEGQQSFALKRLRNQVSHGAPNLTGFHQSFSSTEHLNKNESMQKNKIGNMVPAGLEPATFGS